LRLVIDRHGERRQRLVEILPDPDVPFGYRLPSNEHAVLGAFVEDDLGSVEIDKLRIGRIERLDIPHEIACARDALLSGERGGRDRGQRGRQQECGSMHV
jgi:hypothetical protein